MNSIALNLEPQQFLAGWRPDAGALFLPALSESRVGEQVVARIGLFGQPVRATVYGKVAMVRRIGRPSLPPGVEIHLDRASVPAARYLAAVAGGEPVTFRVRAPRFTLERTVVVSVRGTQVEAKTLTLSEGGASIAWPAGDAPTPGELLALRFANGFLAPSTDAVVCWTSNDPSERAVGVRIVSEGRGGRAWRALVDQTAKGPVRTV
ncbi:MAG: PilZ domain-containing protein [Deltaproteobacteria bacterium]